MTGNCEIWGAVAWETGIMWAFRIDGGSWIRDTSKVK